MESLKESMEISDIPKRDLESSVEHVGSSVEHKANSISLVASLNILIKLVEQVGCPNRSGEQVSISESLAGSLGSSVECLGSSDLEQEVLSLQEE